MIGSIVRPLPLLLLVGCGWFASSTPVPGTDPSADPSALLPTCRPANAPEGGGPRGEPPWKAGQALASGWSVSAVETDNAEYIRVVFTRGADTTKIEVAYNEGGPGDWATARYRLMPAPDQTPPEDLLQEAMTTLRAADAGSGPPFVIKRVGVVDPYAGLPPCAPAGTPP